VKPARGLKNVRDLTGSWFAQREQNRNLRWSEQVFRGYSNLRQDWRLEGLAIPSTIWDTCR